MNKIFLASMLIVTPSYLLAGGTNGGTPPAREHLEELLMSAKFASAGLFDNEVGDISLLTNRELQPRMALSRSQLPTMGVKVSEGDFEQLRERKLPIDSVGTSGEIKSYTISDGDDLDTLILSDRRATARAEVSQ